MTKEQELRAITLRFLEASAELIGRGMVKSRSEFAQMIGEHQQNLSLMDKGERTPTLYHIVNLCRKFDYNTHWILLGEGPRKIGKQKKETKISIEQRLDDAEAELARLSRKMKQLETR